MFGFPLTAEKPITLPAPQPIKTAPKEEERRLLLWCPRGKWWPGTVRYVLDNPKYRGDVEYLFRWNGAETHVVRDGVHPAII